MQHPETILGPPEIDPSEISREHILGDGTFHSINFHLTRCTRCIDYSRSYTIMQRNYAYKSPTFMHYINYIYCIYIEIEFFFFSSNIFLQVPLGQCIKGVADKRM